MLIKHISGLYINVVWKIPTKANEFCLFSSLYNTISCILTHPRYRRVCRSFQGRMRGHLHQQCRVVSVSVFRQQNNCRRWIYLWWYVETLDHVFSPVTTLISLGSYHCNRMSIYGWALVTGIQKTQTRVNFAWKNIISHWILYSYVSC